ncbi:MAG: zinc ribbon domain-containing protein [Gammaproteobacteria bacterium]|nr:zinc ribbon domain-containing protein [Gammaproteobacteria bacterium]
MPIYEYKCSACGHQLEVIQRMSDEPKRDCPICGAANLEKQISRVGFRLKGTGWYETDFKNKGKPGDAKKTDGEGAAKSDAGGEAKPAEAKPTEAKPADSAPAKAASSD